MQIVEQLVDQITVSVLRLDRSGFVLLHLLSLLLEAFGALFFHGFDVCLLL